MPLVSVPPSAPQSTATGAVGVSGISSVDDIITTTTTGASSSLAMPGVPARLALRRRRAEPSLLSFRELLEHRHAGALRTLDGLLLFDELLDICQPHAPTSARLPGIPVRRRQSRRGRRDCRGSQSVAGTSPVRAQRSSVLYRRCSNFAAQRMVSIRAWFSVRTTSTASAAPRPSSSLSWPQARHCRAPLMRATALVPHRPHAGVIVVRSWA